MAIHSFLAPINLLPVFACIAFGLHLWYCNYFLRKRLAKGQVRLNSLRRGRTLIPVLPLTGLLGTLLGLMDTLNYMGEKSSDLANQMGEILLRFAPCLSTTVIGVIGAASYMVLYNICVSRLEDSIDEEE